MQPHVGTDDTSFLVFTFGIGLYSTGMYRLQNAPGLYNKFETVHNYAEFFFVLQIGSTLKYFLVCDVN